MESWGSCDIYIIHKYIYIYIHLYCSYYRYILHLNIYYSLFKILYIVISCDNKNLDIEIRQGYSSDEPFTWRMGSGKQ